jgi:hypothetical protein
LALRLFRPTQELRVMLKIRLRCFVHGQILAYIEENFGILKGQQTVKGFVSALYNTYVPNLFKIAL